jgi:uncharacterized membrane protein YphA (DoxX/SURF4 family)
MKKTILVEIIAFLFIILFLYTGISKLMDYSVFKEQIALSPILSPVSKWVAVLLPGAEIIVSLMLFIPRSRSIGLYASLLLMTLFTGYIIYILIFNDRLPCTCGGVLEALSWKQHLLLNIFLVGLALTAIIIRRKSSPNLERAKESSLFGPAPLR